MPETEVLLFAEEDGSAPLLDWLDGLPAKVQDKCIVRIERLAELGYELRRPDADLLRDGMYELRASYQNVHYRMLYFFHEQRAVVTHGLTKERQVPDREIELALRRKAAFESEPEKHTYREEE
jgi:phage-related protein